jgi:HlyD family secretion protein
MARSWLLVPLLVGFAAGAGSVAWVVRDREARAAGDQSAANLVAGRTQPAPGHVGILAPVVRQPVHEVLVAEGDKVRKGQPLIKLDDEDARLKLKAKKADLEAEKATLAELKTRPRHNKIDSARAAFEKAQIAAAQAKEKMQRLKPLAAQGVVAEKKYESARAEYEEAEKEVRSAKDDLQALQNAPVNMQIAEQEAKVRSAAADVAAAESDLEDCTITAPIDGVVAWLRASPGSITRPGTAVWGEIIASGDIEVRCVVPAALARGLEVGQAARVFDESGRQPLGEGKVVRIGLAADEQTGHLPVMIRLANSDGRLPCYVPVKVSFGK